MKIARFFLLIYIPSPAAPTVIYGSARQIFLFFGHEHHGKADRQQSTAYPYRPTPKRRRQDAAKTRAYTEYKYHAEICGCFAKRFFVPLAEIVAQCFGARAQIADAHSAGVSMSAHLVECLHLHCAHERYQRVGKRIDSSRQKADDEQERDLARKNDLPPVQSCAVFHAYVYVFRYRRPDDKGYDRNDVFKNRVPLLPEQSPAQQYDIARLGVCEYLAAAKAEKAAVEEEKQQYAKRLEAAEAEIDEMKKAALESARQTAAQYMKEAEAECRALLQKTQKEAEAERRKLRGRANAEIGEMVSEAIDKALASRDADPVDDFIGKAKKGA